MVPRSPLQRSLTPRWALTCVLGLAACGATPRAPGQGSGTARTGATADGQMGPVYTTRSGVRHTQSWSSHRTLASVSWSVRRTGWLTLEAQAEERACLEAGAPGVLGPAHADGPWLQVGADPDRLVVTLTGPAESVSLWVPRARPSAWLHLWRACADARERRPGLRLEVTARAVLEAALAPPTESGAPPPELTRVGATVAFHGPAPFEGLDALAADFDALGTATPVEARAPTGQGRPDVRVVTAPGTRTRIVLALPLAAGDTSGAGRWAASLVAPARGALAREVRGRTGGAVERPFCTLETWGSRRFLVLGVESSPSETDRTWDALWAALQASEMDTASPGEGAADAALCVDLEPVSGEATDAHVAADRRRAEVDSTGPGALPGLATVVALVLTPIANMPESEEAAALWAESLAERAAAVAPLAHGAPEVRPGVYRTGEVGELVWHGVAGSLFAQRWIWPVGARDDAHTHGEAAHALARWLGRPFQRLVARVDAHAELDQTVLTITARTEDFGAVQAAVRRRLASSPREVTAPAEPSMEADPLARALRAAEGHLYGATVALTAPTRADDGDRVETQLSLAAYGDARFARSTPRVVFVGPVEVGAVVRSARAFEGPAAPNGAPAPQRAVPAPETGRAPDRIDLALDADTGAFALGFVVGPAPPVRVAAVELMLAHLEADGFVARELGRCRPDALCFVIGGLDPPGASTETRLRARIATLAATPLPPTPLQMARGRRLTQLAVVWDTPTGMVGWLAQQLERPAGFLGHDATDRWRAALDEATSAHVAEVALALRSTFERVEVRVQRPASSPGQNEGAR